MEALHLLLNLHPQDEGEDEVEALLLLLPPLLLLQQGKGEPEDEAEVE